MKKLLSILMALVMCFGVFSGALAEMITANNLETVSEDSFWMEDACVEGHEHASEQIETTGKQTETEQDSQQQTKGGLVAESAVTTRSDGVWLFPLDEYYYNRFSDWAGCPGLGKCVFHNAYGNNHYGDGWHTGQPGGHAGVDIYAPIGTVVKAAAGGKAFSGYDGSRGKYVVIEHELGQGWSYYSIYQHLSSVEIDNGAVVAVGQRIALSGNTPVGAGYGPHLHFGIFLGKSGELGEHGEKIGTLVNKDYNYDWVTTPGMHEGKIVNNPALNSPAGFPTGDIDSLRPHAGSVMYTTNKSEVSIGSHQHHYASQGTGVCTECGEVFNWQATYDTSCANTGTVLKPDGFYPRDKMPYDASHHVSHKLKAGSPVTILGSYKNAYDNIWYYISYNNGTSKGYAYSDWIQPDAKPSSMSVSITWPSENQTIPKLAHRIGGTVTSSSYPIKKIEGFFDGHTKADAVVSVSTMSYNLATPAFDDQLLFNALSSGRHTIKIVATDSNGGKATLTRTFYTEMSPCEAATVTTEDANGGKYVVMSCPGANISYTTNIEMTGSGTGTVRAYITTTTTFTITTSKSGRSNNVITKTISVDQVQAPQFSAVEWYGGTRVTITSAPGAQIYYYFEGTQHGEYCGTFNVEDECTVYAYAVKNGMRDSAVTSFHISAIIPCTPTVHRLNTDSRIAVGKTASFSWESDSAAKEYVVSVYKDGTLLKTETQQSNVYSMVLSSAGFYEISVKAKNSITESNSSERVSVTAVAPSTVRFVDDDNSILAEYTVPYGECVGRQNNPSHKGHNFSGWYPVNNYYEIPVVQDVTYTATYTPIEYNVMFYDVDGAKFGETQKIPYLQSATLPDYSAYVPGGYVFTGWTVIEASDKESMCDYTHVDADLKLQAVIRWENDEFPIYVSISSANVVSEGNGSVYSIVIDASNWPTAASNVYFVAALKTQDTAVSVYKTVYADRVSVNFTEGDIKTVTIPLHYDGIAKRVEVFALERKADDTTGSAYSTVASSSIVFSTTWTDWSEWSTTAPQEISGRDIDSKTQYRYQTKETTTSSNNTMSGWTLYDSSWVWGAWGAWSSWSTSAQSSNDYTQVETKTQYRYRTKQYTTSTSSSLSGWTQVGSHVEYGPWSSYQYTTTQPTESDTLHIVSSSITGYNYYHYCCNYYDGCYNVDSIPYGNTSSTHRHTIHRTSALPSCSIGDMGGRQAYGGQGSGAPACSSNFFVWFLENREYTYVYQTRTATTYYEYEKWGDWSSWSDNSVSATSDRQVETRTVYRYRTRSQVWTYYFYHWTDWSSWSDTPVTANSNTNVQTRTVYRYRDAVPVYDPSAGTEDVSGNIYLFEGSISSDQDLTGKVATIMVYQSNNMDPNQYQMKYVGQTTILSNNRYSISFIPSNEPTVESGNYVVSLGVQGTTGLINVDVIEAPKPEYTVRFLMDDGTVLSTQTVLEGDNAVVPELPEKPGYRFIGWSDRSTDIYRNIDITARYERIQYMVAFVDWANQNVGFQMYYYGDTITAPYTPEAEGRTFVGWDAILNDNATVTDNMVVSAVYDTAAYTVRFMDGEGNVLESQLVEHGGAANLPEAVEAEGKVFLGWSTEVMWWNVTEDMDVLPILAYEETTIAPMANIESLECGLETNVEFTSEDGAVIYYTLDGTTPTTESEIYTGAIHLEETTIISAMAVVEGKNESEVVNVFFVYDDTPAEDWLGTVIQLDTMTVIAEAEAEIPIGIEINCNPGLTGYSLILECDTSVFYIDSEEDGIVCIPGEVSTTGTFYVSSYGETGWKITWISDEPIESNGILFTIPLKVGEEAGAGNYEITLGYVEGDVYTLESDEVEMTHEMVHFSGSEDAVTFSLSSVDAIPGSDVTIDLNIDGEYEANALTITIIFDAEKVTLNSVTKGGLWLEMLNLDATVMQNTNTPGIVRMMAILPSSSISSSGKLLTLNLHVADDIELGTDVPISLEVQEFFTSPLGGEDTPIPFVITSGVIHVDCLLGDVNGDYLLNASDVIMIMRYALGMIDLTPRQLTAADYNGDSEINASDALMLMRKCLGII